MPIFCWIILIQKILRESQEWLSLRHQYWFWILMETSSFGKWLTTRRRLTEIASLVSWTSLFYCLINQSEFADASVRSGKQNGVIIAGIPFLLSQQIPSPFFLPPSFLSYLPPLFDAFYAGYARNFPLDRKPVHKPRITPTLHVYPQASQAQIPLTEGGSVNKENPQQTFLRMLEVVAFVLVGGLQTDATTPNNFGGKISV